ncbi:MAG: GNAT family N-acetyltransferase, partial [Parcubacteria group bacterium]
RLYLPGNSSRAFVRELHTYGEMMPVDSGKKAVQHIGFGKRLMAEVEHVAREKGFKKLAVIAGIGVKEYYRKLGYRDENTYVVKRLTN